jgi:CubicO group peptidase (beta-lactamase class C family)
MGNRRTFLRTNSLALAAFGIGAHGAFAQRVPRKTGSSTPSERPSTLRSSVVLQRVLDPVRDKHHLPGFIGAVVGGQGIQAIGAVGIRKIGATDPITVNDQVHIGSDTKAMTATMIGTVVEEGKLRWSSTIAEVFPAQAPMLHSDFRGVTLWQLLTHRAGLPSNGPWDRLGWGRSPTDQRRELLARMLRAEPASKPGTTFAYSNVGYALAGLMAEEVTGQSWESLMRERLFEPLEMTSAGFGTPGTRGKVDQPWGHRSRRDQVVPAQDDNPPSMGPAGTVHCSVPDWAKFAILHMRAAQGRPRLLKTATFRKLQTPDRGSEYAGGWGVGERSWAGGRVLSHSGSNTLWYATAWIAPVRGFAILVATNCGNEAAKTACDEAVTELIKYHDSPNARG